MRIERILEEGGDPFPKGYRLHYYPEVAVITNIEFYDGEPENGIKSFFVELAYNNSEIQEPSDWDAVAHFDHNPPNPSGHDVLDEGLHMDVLRQGEKVDRKTEDEGHFSPPSRLSRYPRYCETQFDENWESLVTDYEKDLGLRRFREQ
jgi:hypothetical protein